VHDDGEGLEECAFGVGYAGREFVAPFRGVRFVALDCAGVGVDAGEVDVWAEVVAAV